MQRFAVSSLAAAAVNASYFDFNIKVDESEVGAFGRSQEWSSLDVDQADSRVTIPNNNSMWLKRDPYDGADYAWKP